MREFFFEKRGIYYRRNEFKSKRLTLFFVHGMSGSSSAWLPYERAFENDYNVLSLDLRGHGKSVRYEKFDDYAVSKFSEDLRELLEYCGVKKCIIISHSFGVFTTLDFIRKNRNVVSAAIFIGPHFAIGKMRRSWLVKSFLSFMVKVSFLLPHESFLDLPYIARNKSLKTGKHIDYSKYVNNGDWNIMRTIADVRNTGLWIFLYTMAQAYNFNGEEILKEIKVPTLIIHGSRDTIIPLKYGIMMAEKIKNSKLVVVDDGDHIIVMNKSKETIKVIMNFIKETKL